VQIKKKRPVSHYVKNKREEPTLKKEIIGFVNEFGTMPAVDSAKDKLTTKGSYKSLRHEREFA
jgi:hypothetical protein